MRDTSRPSPRLVYVIGTYPVATTTFIDREIEALRRLGVPVRVVAIRRPRPEALSENQRLLQRGVRYVLPARVGPLIRTHLSYLVTSPGVYVRTLVELLAHPHPSFRARAKTVLHFGLGVYVAGLLGNGKSGDHLHAHFVDRAALVAMVAGRLLNRPFSATAHANDIYVDPVLLPEKLRSAKFVATCTRYNEAHLRATLNGASGKIRCIYHGLEVREYAARRRSRRDRPLIFSVGQLKEKKGFGDLLQACRILRERGVDFECEIVGDGPLREALSSQIERLELRGSVSLLGRLPHETVIRKYREATLFALACVTAQDGDRDGIPNVILEAMASGLPVVSTRHSGIPEAVEDEKTGLLVPPGRPEELAEAIGRLLGDETLRNRFGRNGRRRVRALFDVNVNAGALLAEVVA